MPKKDTEFEKAFKATIANIKCDIHALNAEVYNQISRLYTHTGKYSDYLHASMLADKRDRERHKADYFEKKATKILKS